MEMDGSRTRQNKILEDLSSSSAGINEADLRVLKTLLTISAPQPKSNTRFLTIYLAQINQTIGLLAATISHAWASIRT